MEIEEDGWHRENGKAVGSTKRTQQKVRERTAQAVGSTRMNKVDFIVRMIESWSDGIQMTAHFANDGDNYFDFMGFEVTESGRKEIEALLGKRHNDESK